MQKKRRGENGDCRMRKVKKYKAKKKILWAKQKKINEQFAFGNTHNKNSLCMMFQMLRKCRAFWNRVWKFEQIRNQRMLQTEQDRKLYFWELMSKMRERLTPFPLNAVREKLVVMVGFLISHHPPLSGRCSGTRHGESDVGRELVTEVGAGYAGPLAVSGQAIVNCCLRFRGNSKRVRLRRIKTNFGGRSKAIPHTGVRGRALLGGFPNVRRKLKQPPQGRSRDH